MPQSKTSRSAAAKKAAATRKRNAAGKSTAAKKTPTRKRATASRSTTSARRTASGRSTRRTAASGARRTTTRRAASGTRKTTARRSTGTRRAAAGGGGGAGKPPGDARRGVGPRRDDGAEGDRPRWGGLGPPAHDRAPRIRHPPDHDTRIVGAEDVGSFIRERAQNNRARGV